MIDKCNHPDWNDCDPHAKCTDNGPGTPSAVLCTCIHPYVGGGHQCALASAGGEEAGGGGGSTTETPSPTSSGGCDPAMSGSCGDGETLINGACYIRRPGGTFNAGSNTCSFKECPWASGYILVGSGTCMTIDRASCDTACAQATCVGAGGSFVAGSGSSWVNPHTCTF
jgi:nitrite reductase/ring-hydroxylating ferredoxin subunit